jgi:hypothetical protein
MVAHRENYRQDLETGRVMACTSSFRDVGYGEIALKYVSPGENGSLFKKLINSDGLAFTWQLENVMKRVTLGEPKQYQGLRSCLQALFSCAKFSYPTAYPT